jgi:hypothetical protein
VQGVRVGLLDVAHGLLERMSDVGALGPDILPVAAFRNLEPVVLGELGKFHVAVGLFQGHVILLIIDVGEPLEEQQREDVGLEIGRVDRTTQDVGRLPEVGSNGGNSKNLGLNTRISRCHSFHSAYSFCS